MAFVSFCIIQGSFGLTHKNLKKQLTFFEHCTCLIFKGPPEIMITVYCCSPDVLNSASCVSFQSMVNFSIVKEGSSQTLMKSVRR